MIANIFVSVQFNQNKGRCGVCGDNWASVQPRPHEAGGRYGKGVIGRRYTTGQVNTYVSIYFFISTAHIYNQTGFEFDFIL